ncbi:hypothetical protein EI555_000685 [Monodon monoceros]|uniref:40S ribosomal protein S3a n=1 Tax=Monodon monoceros TaxID=40151 RepID=A0A4U1EYS2_MONMO|nr:hypothetical protein EI555_000685 [Monodon monoceros]
MTDRVSQGKNVLTEYLRKSCFQNCKQSATRTPSIAAQMNEPNGTQTLQRHGCGHGFGKTSYARHQQVHQIHKKVMEIMTGEEQTNDLKKVVNKLIPDSIGKDTEKVHDVFVRKVKMLKKPKFELGKLTELQGEGSSPGKAIGDETGAKVE